MRRAGGLTAAFFAVAFPRALSGMCARVLTRAFAGVLTRAFAGVLACAFAGVLACSDLKNAPPSLDAGEQHDGRDAQSHVRDDAGEPPDFDAGVDGGDAGRPPCPEPCKPEQLLARQSMGALAVDDVNIYFASAVAADISACPKAGCAGVPTLLADVVTHRLAVAGGKVWWGNASKSQLQSCAVGGCNDHPDTVLVNNPEIADVVTDGTTIAWSVRVDDGDIVRSCPVVHCADAVQDVIKLGAIASGIAAAGGTVWFANSVSKQVATCPISTSCNNVPKVYGAGDFGIVVAPPTAYWVKEKNIVACALVGCNTLPAVAAMSDGPGHIAVDEHDIYWRDATSKKILRCPRAGGCAVPEVIAEGVEATIFMTIALDSDWVYWTDNRGVWRRHK